MKSIDLNVDIGEGFQFDADLLLYATSANICCGVHAGSWALTQETIGLALDMGVRIGMHPGYDDRESMGRVSIHEDLMHVQQTALERQIEQFFNFVPPAYLKPHGALYHDSMSQDHWSWEVLSNLADKYQLTIMGMAGTAHELLAGSFISEGFSDRGYDATGKLIPRGTPGAILEGKKEIADQAIKLAAHTDSLCLHGDTPNCVQMAEIVFSALSNAGYAVERPE